MVEYIIQEKRQQNPPSPELLNFSPDSLNVSPSPEALDISPTPEPTEDTPAEGQETAEHRASRPKEWAKNLN
jgi:hypothetical protein